MGTTRKLGQGIDALLDRVDDAADVVEEKLFTTEPAVAECMLTAREREVGTHWFYELARATGVGGGAEEVLVGGVGEEEQDPEEGEGDDP